jgi:hypothetical protein
MDNPTVRKIIREANKTIRIYKKIIGRIQEMQLGDLYYWPKEKKLIKVMSIVWQGKEPDATTFDDEFHLGRIEVEILCSEKTYGSITNSCFIQSCFIQSCINWERVSVKDFPLYINSAFKSKEFYRLLAKGE